MTLAPVADKLGGPRIASLSGPLATGFATASAFAVVALVNPNEPGNYPTCPFLLVTGHWCPGCGTLRAMHALTRGDLQTALSMNVMTVSMLPLLGVLWWRWTRRRWNGVSPPAPVHPAYLWAVLGVVVVFWIVRNLSIGSALAP